MTSRHLDEGMLRAYIDRETSIRQAEDVSRHLTECVDCRARFAEIEQAATLAAHQISSLAPGAADRPAEPALAMAAVRRRARLARPIMVARPTLRDRVSAFAAGLRAAHLAAAAVPIALAAAIAISPLGGAAQGLLSVFRVSQVQAIQLDKGLLPSLPEPADLGTLNAPQNPNFRAATLADAGRAAGLTPRQIGALPAGLAVAPRVMVSDPLEGSFTYDLAKLQTYYTEHSLKGTPPAELDGLTIKGSMTPALIQIHADQQTLDSMTAAMNSRDKGSAVEAKKASADALGKMSLRYLALVQAHSPKLEVPGNVDIGTLRTELLNNGSLPPEIAQQLAAISDWQNTLPIPVLKGTSRDVTVDGVHGVLVAAPNSSSWLIWQKDGIVYGITGSVSESDLLAAANSLH